MLVRRIAPRLLLKLWCRPTARTRDDIAFVAFATSGAPSSHRKMRNKHVCAHFVITPVLAVEQTGAGLLLRSGRGCGDVWGKARALLEEGRAVPREEEGGVRT